MTTRFAMDVKTHTLVVIHLAGIWDTFHRRHLILSLADALPDGWAILCVNRPVTFDVTLVKNPRRFIYGLRHRHPRQISTRLLLYTPWQISHEIIAGRLPFLTIINRWLVHRQLRRILSDRFLNVEKLISWIYHPVQSWVHGLRSGEKLVYEVYDEYRMRPDGTIVSGFQEREMPILGLADLTFVTAEVLAERRRDHTDTIVYLPNGVPQSFLNAGIDGRRYSDRPAKPRIGFLGHLRAEINVALLEQLAGQNPQWHFVFYGPVQKKQFGVRLQRLANVEFAGPQPYEQLPDLLRQLDIGLVPFLLNDFTKAINPLKAYEFMASGVPIVASDLPELRRFKDIFHVVDNTPEAFAKAITDTLAANRTSLSKKLATTAQQYTWDTICHNVVIPALRGMLSGKNGNTQNHPGD